MRLVSAPLITALLEAFVEYWDTDWVWKSILPKRTRAYALYSSSAEGFVFFSCQKFTENSLEATANEYSEKSSQMDSLGLKPSM
ncbi:unnamed protein product [Heligmosomoides polygyrus]|uniref:Secreted protein n=1 Tax=Heligmosomoides polygyrus TaxID=6339 RepID=A0A183FD95_HELPZ|nr:unnamed protein product [Heligmosomoides polygyrus]